MVGEKFINQNRMLICYCVVLPPSLPHRRAVAVYFIDKLALRAGNEKDADESADTVGCCSLRVEHLSE